MEDSLSEGVRPRHALPALVWVLAACGATKPSAPGELPPDLALTKVTLREYRGSTPTLVATTPSFGFHREGPMAGQIVAQRVVIDSLSDGLHVEAQRVTGDALGGVLVGETVRARTDGGAVIDSPLATFDRSLGESGTASTDAGVHLEHPEFTLDAEEGWYDVAAERAELTQVRSLFRGRAQPTSAGGRAPPRP
jgi:hypothetical protein